MIDKKNWKLISNETELAELEKKLIERFGQKDTLINDFIADVSKDLYSQLNPDKERLRGKDLYT